MTAVIVFTVGGAGAVVVRVPVPVAAGAVSRFLLTLRRNKSN